MPLPWPGPASQNSDVAEDFRLQMVQLLDRFADDLAAQLAAHGLELHASPIFRPFSVAILREKSRVIVQFGIASGMAQILFFDEPAEEYTDDALSNTLVQQYDWLATSTVVLPHPEHPNAADFIRSAAEIHAEEVVLTQRLRQLGDIEHVRHLERYLQTFVDDHPTYDQNVFVMMRFNDSDQMRSVFAAIKSALASRGMNAVRADDRDYTGELWSNIEVYLTGCKYGIAVFEDINDRDYNPNVSLELGYMMGRGKRTLLLKEKRLPKLPTDVVGKLYKEFDMFDITASVEREVGRWVDVDLGLRGSTSPRP